MKRLEQLQTLSKEHHQSLRLAKQCRNMAEQADTEVLAAFSRQLKKDFEQQWQHHFSVEEDFIFTPAESKGGEISDICARLKDEHGDMAQMVEQIAAGEYHLLADFGQLLHDHTRCEERQLFPLVEARFSKAELDAIQGADEGQDHGCRRD